VKQEGRVRRPQFQRGQGEPEATQALRWCWGASPFRSSSRRKRRSGSWLASSRSSGCRQWTWRCSITALKDTHERIAQSSVARRYSSKGVSATTAQAVERVCAYAPPLLSHPCPSFQQQPKGCRWAVKRISGKEKNNEKRQKNVRPLIGFFKHN